MASEPAKYEDDDGRVICSMDVPGMPWHDRRARQEKKAAARSAPQGDQLTQEETRRVVWNAVLAGLLVAGVFAATWILFILFCINVWFR